VTSLALTRPALALAAALCLSATIALAVPPAASQQGGFTAAERADLDRGRLVTRPRTSTSASESWLGGVAFQVIERPPDDVWSALQHVPAYHHMLPGLPTARLEARDGAVSIVYLRHASMGVEAQYSVRMRWNQVTRAMSFELDPSRPHDVESARGFLEVRPYPRHPERSLITWGVRARLGVGVLEELFAADIQTWLLRVPSTVKGYLEGAGREHFQQR
jgi:hypothetical protein